MNEYCKKLLALSILCASAGSAMAVDGNAADEISAAAAALAEAESLGMVWAVWDDAGGKDDPTELDTLLGIAREKQAAGDEAEAVRIARKVAYLAREGIAQGKAAN